MQVDKIMYTLGQLARAIWPDGVVPEGVLSIVFRSPAEGLGEMMRHAEDPRGDAVGALVSRLPADMPSPRGGVGMGGQAEFWLGYHHYAHAMTRAKVLTPADLAQIGVLLYGDRWQSDLARSLGVGDRRVREWVAGDRRIPAGVWADLAGLLRQRDDASFALLGRLTRAAENDK